MIDLHYSATPNGQKIAVMLEEIGAPYRVIPYDIFNGDQLTAEFGRINPNHKLPAIVDRDPAEGGDPITVFESGAILQYLAEKSGRFLPASGAARAARSEEHTSELQSLMRSSYAVFGLTKKKKQQHQSEDNKKQNNN